MTRRMLLVALLLTTAGRAIAAAQPATGPAGHWEGTIEVPGQALGIQVDLGSKDGAWMGTISIPAQNLKGFPLSEITVAAAAVGFAMKGVPGEPRFKGTLSPDGKQLGGDFTQGGGTIPFNLEWKGDAKFEQPAKSTEITSEFEGSWEGALDVQGTVLRLVLKLTNHPGGATGVLVSLDQGGVEIPIASITQTLSHLAFAITLINASYAGDLKDSQIVGTWTQGPGSWPLVFKRPAK